LARSLALAFLRIQFTSDLLPADILGNHFRSGRARFVFHRGPLFAQMVLIDEVNRATAKTSRVRCWKQWKNIASPSTA
jgi:MoxR-like ATPase